MSLDIFFQIYKIYWEKAFEITIHKNVAFLLMEHLWLKISLI